MNDYFAAFDRGPVSERGIRAVAPEIFRGIYAMPAFVTIPTADLEASVDFWVRGLGFVELFRNPSNVVHLRRWIFQDVLLVPATPDAVAVDAPAMSVSFSCVLSEIEHIAESCTSLLPGSASEPRDTPWLTRDVEVVTPERARVICTAPREFDPDSPEGQSLLAAGILAPDVPEGGDNGLHG